MSGTPNGARRAARLARWYPLIWRERYGVEFVELLEQEISEQPRNLRRSVNIAYRGSVARCRELGLSSSTLNPSDQPRAALATVFVTSAIFGALALNFWSIAMLSWNSYWTAPSSLVATALTGILTVLACVVVALVVVTFFTLLWTAGRRIVKGHAKGLVTSLSLIVSSVILIVIATLNVLRYVVARGGIDWNQPGQAIKQLAGIAGSEVTTINWIWMSPRESLTLSSNVFDGLIPVALLVLVISVGVLIRRTNLSVTAQRSGRIATLVLVSAMALFVIAFGGLVACMSLVSVFGGPPSFSPLILEFVLMVVMTALAVQALRRLLKSQRPVIVEAS